MFYRIVDNLHKKLTYHAFTVKWEAELALDRLCEASTVSDYEIVELPDADMDWDDYQKYLQATQKHTIENFIKDKNWNEKYHAFAICVLEGKLALIPCIPTLTGYEPLYEESVTISESEISYFPDRIGKKKIDAILLRQTGEELSIDFVENNTGEFEILN